MAPPVSSGVEPAALVAVTAREQDVVPGQELWLTVKALDREGRGMAGVPVLFAAYGPASGSGVNPAQDAFFDTTDAGGRADYTWTVPAEHGAYTVRAAACRAAWQDTTCTRWVRGSPIAFALQASGFSDWTSISAGQGHTCAVTTDGKAYCWGSAALGRLGNEEYRYNFPTPVAVLGGHTWTSISAGFDHTCGITTDSLAYCWGDAGRGQLGTSTDPVTTGTPTLVAGGHRWRAITTGFYLTCGITTAGEAYCWGGAISGTTLPTPTPVPGSHVWTDIDVGWTEACGVADGGQAYCWIPLPSAGFDSTLLVPGLVPGGHSWSKVSVGISHRCGIDTDGTALCWDYAGYGGLGDGSLGNFWKREPGPVSGTHTWRSLSASYRHTCGVAADSVAYCWGDGAYGQLGDGLSGSGHVDPTPHAVRGGLMHFRTASAGMAHSCGITPEGEAYCWGDDTQGQLGDGSVADAPRLKPVRVTDPPDSTGGG
ncbi:MAG TPA: hypothetical protein VJ957_10185 [Longimicrobiales bacterium]|nr:hypothetical protein [Longimicrobiales bacterium]